MTRLPHLIFIADDDEDDQLLLQLAFQDHSPPCQLIFSENGQILLDQLAQATTLPRLIILDLNMPVMNGVETLCQLRANPQFASIPVVILTTSSSPKDQQRVMELGAVAFVTKPIHLAALQQLVQSFCDTWLLGCKDLN